MAKSRRKSSGCNRGKFKAKRMGKGWLAHRRKPQPQPQAPKAKAKEGAAASKDASAAS